MPIDYSALALFQRILQAQQQQQQMFTDGVATAGNGQAGVDFTADEAALNNIEYSQAETLEQNLADDAFVQESQSILDSLKANAVPKDLNQLLVAEIQSCPYLWNKQSNEYKQAHKKKIAWGRVAEKLSIDGMFFI